MGLVSLYLSEGMRFIYNGHANEGGIYRITNQINGRFYIGSTCQFKVRWSDHRSRLLRGTHGNPFLQNDFNKCGADAFIVEVLAIIPDRDLRYKAEGELIRQHFGEGCYNLEPDVGPSSVVHSRPRKPHTEETKEKIRQSKIGHPVSDETREKLRAAHTGKLYGHRSGETRAKLREAWVSRVRRGTPMSDEAKEKIRQAKLGKIHTEETKKKMRASRRAYLLRRASEKSGAAQ